MQDFRNLRVWHLAKQFAVDLSRLLPPGSCRGMPGFRSQILRAALSISGNIAEGCGKRSRLEFRRYLESGLSSLMEVESDLHVAVEGRLLAGYDYTSLDRKAAVLRRMLISLMHRLEQAGDNP